jgi:hypothetical protein
MAEPQGWALEYCMNIQYHSFCLVVPFFQAAQARYTS